MSLEDAVLDIADGMEAEAADLAGTAGAEYCCMTLRSYARQIRRCVKAVEGVTPPSQQQPSPFLLPETQNRDMIERAKAEFRGKHRRGEAEEGVGGMVAEVCGGKAHGDMVEVDLAMPYGAKTELLGDVYVWGEDRKWHFSEEETTKRNNQKKQIIVPGS